MTREIHDKVPHFPIYRRKYKQNWNASHLIIHNLIMKIIIYHKILENSLEFINQHTFDLNNFLDIRNAISIRLRAVERGGEPVIFTGAQD
jgi:hypothetical protein